MAPSRLPVLLLLALPLAAQSNAVPGTDIQVYDVGGSTIYGRRGPAHPGGEVGVGWGHSYCNGGSVHLPWVGWSGSIMLDTYPKIAFLLARESNGRMVQVSAKGHLKHSRVAYNFSSGPCGPCQSGPSGTMRIGCSDTYSTGFNGDRYNLGPTDEIDPWLGTWNSQGSYFDRGDPAVSGSAAMDRVQSLTQTQVSAFDPVKNRVTVREAELSQPGTYHGQIHLVIQGEPAQNRGNNLMSRQLSFNWNGSSWSTGAAGGSFQGSVLTRWSGATYDQAGNGNDDGSFLVAVKVTGPVGGMWHYEYAVHNIDNHRGGASLRIPVDPSATVTNPDFRDIDDNPLNQWAFSRAGNQIAFTAAANNPLDWNSIYNFSFDCSVAPSSGAVLIDEARIGPGLLTLAVNGEVPSGIPTARVQSVGTGCGDCDSSFYEFFASPAAMDLTGRSMTLTYNSGQYSVGSGTSSFVTPTGSALPLSDDSEITVALPFSLPYPGGSTTQIRVCSNGFISPAGSNGTAFTPSVSAFLAGQPRWAGAWHDFNPASGGQVIVGSSASGVNVTWNNVVNFGSTASSTFQYQFLPSGTVHVIWQSMSTAGNAYLVGWTPGSASDPGSRDLSATLAAGFSLCTGSATGISLGASARPVLGTTINLITSSIQPGTAFGITVLSLVQAVPPVNLTSFGMEGCEAHHVGGVNQFWFGPGATVQLPLPIPNNPGLAGLPAVSQSYAYSPPLTTLGLIASNGIVLTLGLQ